MRHRNFKPLDSGLSRVLIIQIDHHLGNTVVSLPTIQAFADHFDHGIDLLVDTRYASLGERINGLRRLIEYPAQRDGHGASLSPCWSIAAIIARLACHRYQAVIDLSGSLRSTPIALLTLSRRRFGSSSSRRSWCYSHIIDVKGLIENNAHTSDRYAEILGCVGRSEKPKLIQLLPHQTALKRTQGILDATWPKDNAPLIVMHPSAGIPWRRWPADRFAAVANLLIKQHNVRVVIVGVDGDRELADSIRNAVTLSTRISFFSGSIEDFIALTTHADVLISNESGPTHVAAACGIPIVTIFGPTREELWAPHSITPRNLTVLRGADCSPKCLDRHCHASMRCLTALEPAQVVQAAQKYLPAETNSTAITETQPVCYE